jgi:hypothetical protein
MLNIIPSPSKGDSQPTLTSNIDPRMIYFDATVMKQYRNLFNISLIHHVSGIMMDKVMSGGLHIRRPGFEPTKEMQSKYERAWSHFLSRVLESWWCFGFAAIVARPDDAIGSVPVVLSPELLRVGMHVDYMGQYQYAFYEECFANGVFGQQSLSFRCIPNVMVHSFTPPSPNAKINSCLSRIQPYLNQLLIATDADIRVITSNSAPSLWTQTRDDAKAAGPDLFGRGTGSLRALAVAPQLGSHSSAEGAANAAAVITQPDPIMPVRVMAASEMDTSGTARSSRMLARLPQLDEGMRVMKLPDGQEGFAFTAAPEPIFLPHFTEMFERAVADAFKVPVQLFSADKFMRSDRTGHSQQTHSSFVMFEQNARSLQTKLLHLLNDVSNALYGAKFREEALIMSASNPQYTEIANASAQVEWDFAPLVSPIVIKELYREGTLKWSAYAAFQSKYHNIAKELFNDDPALSLEELNGIQPASEISNENDT